MEGRGAGEKAQQFTVPAILQGTQACFQAPILGGSQVPTAPASQCPFLTSVGSHTYMAYTQTYVISKQKYM